MVRRSGKISHLLEDDTEARGVGAVTLHPEGGRETAGVGRTHDVTAHVAENHVAEVEHVVREARPSDGKEFREIETFPLLLKIFRNLSRIILINVKK